MLIPRSNKATRPGLVLHATHITFHETDNTDRGANAFAHARLQQSGNPRQASWHATCDSKDIIYLSIPYAEIAYHCGTPTGNYCSIGVEMCVNSDGDFEKTKDNAVWLIRSLMKKYNVPAANVVPHKHWSGKDCPHKLLSDSAKLKIFLDKIAAK